LGLVFSTSKWSDALWSGHVAHSQTAKAVLADGQHKQKTFPRFAEDVHSALYLKHLPAAQDNAPAWANELLNQAQDLAEWSTLKQRCLRNGFAAGLAAETVLHALVPLVPTQQDAQQDGQTGQPGQDTGAMRRALRHACRAAGTAIDTAESALEGMQDALGIQAGHGVSTGETMQDIDQLRTLYEVLRSNATMRRIAELAGRLQRLGASHKRTKVQPAVGAIKGVTVGGDIDRLLPGELVGLRSTNRYERLRTLQKIMDKRAIQYLMHGDASEVKGPILVCCDESGSIRVGGLDIWTKAVALALLATATEQRRAYTLLGFTEVVEHEITVHPGQASLSTLLPHLTRHCRGGTSFDAPLRRALALLHTAPSMHKADIVFITDGEADVAPEVLAQLEEAKAAHGVCVYGIAVGRSANLSMLRTFCTQVYHVSETPEQDGATVAPVIALVA
jgi:uncharacterized protein with von Willebrand factor type A (vWA) domain